MSGVDIAVGGPQAQHTVTTILPDLVWSVSAIDANIEHVVNLATPSGRWTSKDYRHLISHHPELAAVKDVALGALSQICNVDEDSFYMEIGDRSNFYV
jgi:hypothetical protein